MVQSEEWVKGVESGECVRRSRRVESAARTMARQRLTRVGEWRNLAVMIHRLGPGSTGLALSLAQYRLAGNWRHWGDHTEIPFVKAY